MEEKNETTIHKRNEIIRGSNTYSLTAQKVANAVYHFVQFNKKYKDEPFTMLVSDIRTIVGLENNNNYIEVIKKAITELSMPIELYNLDRITGHRKRGQDTLWQVVQFLHDPEIFKEGKDLFLEARMSPTMRVLIANSAEGNFTPLVLNTYLNKVKSKHSYILYEYMKSFENFNLVGNKIPLDYERLDHMFNLEHNKKYRYFSSFKQLLQRCIDDLNDNTDICVELSINKKEKKYYIHRIKNKEEATRKKVREQNYNKIDAHPLGKLATNTLKRTEERGEVLRGHIVDVVDAEIEGKRSLFNETNS